MLRCNSYQFANLTFWKTHHLLLAEWDLIAFLQSVLESRIPPYQMKEKSSFIHALQIPKEVKKVQQREL